MKTAFEWGGSLASFAEGYDVKENNLAPKRAVMFVVNHHIPNNGSTFDSLEFDATDKLLAHAVILGHPRGTPHIYSDLGKDTHTGIEMDRYKRSHSRSDIAAMLSFRKVMVNTELRWLKKSDHALVFESGNSGLVAINKAVEDTVLDGEYQNLLAQERSATGAFQVKDGHTQRLVLKGRQSAMYLLRRGQ